MGDWQGRILWLSTAVTAVIVIGLFASFRGGDPAPLPASAVAAPTPVVGGVEQPTPIADPGAEFFGAGGGSAADDLNLREVRCGEDKLPGGDAWVKDSSCSFFVAITTLTELGIPYAVGIESYPVFDASAIDEPVIVDAIIYSRDAIENSGVFNIVPTGTATVDDRFELATVRLGLGS